MQRTTSSSKNDFAGLRAALTPIEKYAREWLPKGDLVGKRWVVNNPTRDDKTAGSFKVNVETGVWKDFATSEKGGGDLIGLWAYLGGVQGQKDILAGKIPTKIGSNQARRELRAKYFGDGPLPESRTDATQRAAKAEEERGEILLPVPPEHAGQPPGWDRKGKLRRPEFVFTYRTQAGELLGYVCRWEKQEGVKGRERKTFAPRFCFRDQDGKIKWRWRGPTGKTTRPLYGLDRLDDRPVLLVEGEKSADSGNYNLKAFACLSWLGGSETPKKVDLSPLAGRKVYLWPDADDPGAKAMDVIGQRLLGLGCEVYQIRPPDGVKKGWDVADAIFEGWDAARCQSLIEDAAQVHPQEPAQPDWLTEEPQDEARPTTRLPFAERKALGTRAYNLLPSLRETARKSDDFEATLREQIEQTTDANEVAGLVGAYGLHLSAGVPVQVDEDTVIQRIRSIAEDRLTTQTTEAIAELIAWAVASRKKRCLSALTLRAEDVGSNHDVKIIRSLDECDLAAIAEPGSVTVVVAPTGTGKTQRVMAPLVARMEGSRRTVSLAHRVALIREHTKRIPGTFDYQNDDVAELATATMLGVCVNSYAKYDFEDYREAADVRILDEWGSIRRSMAAVDALCAEKGKMSAVYSTVIQDLAAPQRTVLAMDATMSVADFQHLERIRPNQRFRVFIAPPQVNGCTVQMLAGGPNGSASITATALVWSALMEGRRVIAPCEGKKSAANLADFLQTTCPEKRVLLLTADTKESPAQIRFLKDPDKESREYDIIIHTATMDAGVSIEHRDALGDFDVEDAITRAGQHFDLGVAFFTGTVLHPASALQMMGRVRYLKEWIVSVSSTTSDEATTADSIRSGLTGATGGDLTDYDLFVSEQKGEINSAKSDFAASLWYALEYNGWTVTRSDVAASQADQRRMKESKKAFNQERRARTVAAVDLSDIDGPRLKRNRHDSAARFIWPDKRGAALQDEITDALRRYDLRRSLGIPQHGALTGDDYDAWNDGQAPRQWDRYLAAVHQLGRVGADDGDLVSRRLDAARVRTYSVLADGRDWRTHRWTQADAAALVARLMPLRHLAAFLGIVPAKRWGAKNPPGVIQPMRVVSVIYDRMGIKMTRKRDLCPAPQVAVFQTSVAWKTSTCGADPDPTNADDRVPNPTIVAEVDRRALQRAAARGYVRLTSEHVERTAVVMPSTLPSTLPERRHNVVHAWVQYTLPARPVVVVDAVIRRKLRPAVAPAFPEESAATSVVFEGAGAMERWHRQCGAVSDDAD